MPGPTQRRLDTVVFSTLKLHGAVFSGGQPRQHLPLEFVDLAGAELAVLRCPDDPLALGQHLLGLLEDAYPLKAKQTTSGASMAWKRSLLSTERLDRAAAVPQSNRSAAVDADTRRRLTIVFDQPEPIRCRARCAQTIFPELHTYASSSLVLMCAIALVYESGTG